MHIYSILLSVAILSGAIRFSGISLVDELAFILLFALLVSYRQKISEPYRRDYVNKYYLRASVSFVLLFSYLIASLCHGFLLDQYFGKFRWLIILLALLIYDYILLFYLNRKLRVIPPLYYLRQIYNYVCGFAIFYLLCGLIANFFGIAVGLLQDAERTGAWYAFWGTSAYTAIIFIPLLFLNKVLEYNGGISKNKFIFTYLITMLASILYDSRVMQVIVILFIISEILSFSSRSLSRFIIGSAIGLFISIIGLQFFLTPELLSSGGFLFTILSDSSDQTVLQDFDRVAHYIAAFKLLSNSPIDAAIGVGFLNAGKAIIPYYHAVYAEYGVNTHKLIHNLSGVSKGTFGLSAFIIENGLIGTFLFFMHLYNLCILAKNTELIVPPIFVLMTYLSLSLVFFSIYINDNMLFYLLLAPSVFLYPVIIKNPSNSIKS